MNKSEQWWDEYKERSPSLRNSKVLGDSLERLKKEGKIYICSTPPSLEEFKKEKVEDE